MSPISREYFFVHPFCHNSWKPTNLNAPPIHLKVTPINLMHFSNDFIVTPNI